MAKKQRLNIDLGERISEFEALMKHFLIQRIIYKIIFRGKGLEFDGYRDFSPEDDAIDIDWKATMRANKVLVRKYIEERDLKIMFVIDVSDNMVFGSAKKLKCEVAAELAGTMAHLIITSGDRVGFTFYNDGVLETVQPKGGKNRFHSFVYELGDPKKYGGNSNLTKTLDFLLDYLDESTSAVIIISDFIHVNKELHENLKLFGQKFETMAMMVKDPLDITFPMINQEVTIEDPVTNQQIIVNPRVAKKIYEKNALEQERMVEEIFNDCGVDLLKINTSEKFVPELAAYLRERAEKGKKVIQRGAI